MPNPNAPPLPALGDLDYQVQVLLPTGSKMSEILLATDRQGQTVVFKIACVQQQARAIGNRRAIHNSVAWLQAMRGHPGIAQLQPIRRSPHTRGQNDGSQNDGRGGVTPPTFVATLPDWPGAPDFLITEYLAGGTLEQLVGKKPLPVDLALALAYDLAQTLAYLHTHGCVHRDLKPENVLFRTPPPSQPIPGELQPVLIDFGIAARSGEAKLTAGSVDWMAPELQTANPKEPLPVDPSSDLYALALICCYMLSGRQPRRRRHYRYQDCIDYRDSVFALLQGEAVQADAAWQQLVTDLQQLLTHALAPTPDQRPTAAEFAATLATLLERMGITPPSHHVTPLPLLTNGSEQVSPLQGLYRLLAPMKVVAIISPMLISVTEKRGGAFAGPWAISLPKRDPVRKFGRWLGIGILSFLGLSLLLTLFTGQPPDTVATAPDVAALQLHTPSQTPTNIPSTTSATVAAAMLPTTTLPPFPAQTAAGIPTLVRVVLPQAAPTLVRFTPTLVPTATATPTLPPATATATPAPPTPTLLPPTATATRPLPTATPPPAPTAIPFAAIRLRQPAANGVAPQERVEFVWEATGATPAADHCYELVFWDPAKAHDKRSPIGAGRASSGIVNFNKLRESADPLLRTLAHSPRGFDWGVRFVSCASPKTILQDVRDTRHYTYQP